MMYSRECLYDVQWQQIRVSMLGTWTSVANVKANIHTLWRYLETGEDLYERATRCSNYMAAILLGYGNKPEWAEQKRLVKQAHSTFIYSLASPPQAEDWDWEKVKLDLSAIQVHFLTACNADLRKRIGTSTRRTGGTQHRPELMKFVGLLHAELTKRGIKT